ncbi:MAG: hypothetical protein QM698_05210 [Micropepsaceae bacterium]
MVFLLRAGFWIAVVAFFMPGDKAADSLTGGARQAAVQAVSLAQGDVYAEVADVCASDPALCRAGMDAVDAAQDLAVQGLDALAAALDAESAISSN